MKDFSLLAGEMVLDNLQTLKCTISGLSTVRTASGSGSGSGSGSVYTDNISPHAGDSAVTAPHEEVNTLELILREEVSETGKRLERGRGLWTERTDLDQN